VRRRPEFVQYFKNALPCAFLTVKYDDKTTAQPVLLKDLIQRREQSALDVIRKMTREQLESFPADLLSASISARFDAATALLLAKGLKSGFAVDAAICMFRSDVLVQLLQAGFRVNKSTLDLALEMRNTVAAGIIRRELNSTAKRLNTISK
jgi:hypothetical protein